MTSLWEGDPVLWVLLLSSAAKLWVLGRARRRPRDAERVGTVASLHLYPVKSAGPVEVQRVTCTTSCLRDGPITDRHWQVTRDEGQAVGVTATNEPLLTTLTPSLIRQGAHHDLQIEAPGMAPLRVDTRHVLSTGVSVPSTTLGDPNTGLDCGDVAASWLNEYLGKTSGRRFRLIHSASGRHRRHVAGTGRFKDWVMAAKDTDEVAYANVTQCHLVSRQSMDELNSRMEAPLSILRFRPNIICDVNSAFDEDTWKEVYIGDAKFTTIKLTGRCPTPCVDADRGVMTTEPLATLHKFRRIVPSLSPVFGLNLVVHWEGDVQVGDVVYASRGDNTRPATS